MSEDIKQLILQEIELLNSEKEELSRRIESIEKEIEAKYFELEGL